MEDENITLSRFYELRYELLPTTIFICGYALIFAVGAIGNILVVIVVTRSCRMRTVTNLFLVNLAVADLLVVVCCMPFTPIGHIFKGWILGSFICKAVPYLQGVSVAASVHTLVAISVERCIAVTWPLSYYFRKSHAFYVILTLWMTSVIITLPYALYFELVEEYPGSSVVECLERWPHEGSGNIYFLVVHLLICFVIPMLIIGVCYTFIGVTICKRRTPGETSNGNVMNRSKVKATKMILTVIMAFAVCWFPLYILVTCYKFNLVDLSVIFGDSAGYAFAFAQWLSQANSCINPVLYHYMDKKFRVAFRHFFCPGEELGIQSRTSSKRMSVTHVRSHASASRQTSVVSMNGGALIRYYRTTKLPSLNEKASDRSELANFMTKLGNSQITRGDVDVAVGEVNSVTKV